MIAEAGALNRVNARLARGVCASLFVSKEGAALATVKVRRICEVLPYYLRPAARHLPHLLEQGLRVATVRAIHHLQDSSEDNHHYDQRRAAVLRLEWQTLAPYVKGMCSSLIRQTAANRDLLDQRFLKVRFYPCCLLLVGKTFLPVRFAFGAQGLLSLTGTGAASSRSL